ncbi:DUF5681 domain-containing protein [Neorhizobium sp. T7_12]|uniref:DUF5681 domain-containing protein n=1 Tax=Neorhizobium sp. T7_12 TaxID=2093832 RepID=UPI000CFA4136|nr:hypothetical protein [Neorhizobium sp. T7_12]
MKIPRLKSTKPDDKRKIVTPERKEALKNMGWKKGQSGNIKGRPPELAEIKEAVQMNALDAVEVMRELMMSSENAATRQRAAAYFIDPFVSKAAQKVDVDVTVTPMGEFLARIAKTRGAVIEADYVETLPAPKDQDDT